MPIPWHEDDTFWETFAPLMFDQERLAIARQEVEELLRLVGAPDSATVLDLCCGPGRHTSELARRGFHVTGVDRTARYLEEARLRLEDTGVDAELVRADMRAFSRPNSFDLALNLYSSFGYFDDQDDDRQVVQNAAANLKPGGALVIEMQGKEVLARVYRERDWRELDDGTLVLEERHLEADWSWMRNRWLRIRQGRIEEHWVQHRLYSSAELTALLLANGFDSVESYGSFSGAPYDFQADRLIAVARTAKSR